MIVKWVRARVVHQPSLYIPIDRDIPSHPIGSGRVNVSHTCSQHRDRPGTRVGLRHRHDRQATSDTSYISQFVSVDRCPRAITNDKMNMHSFVGSLF